MTGDRLLGGRLAGVLPSVSFALRLRFRLIFALCWTMSLPRIIRDVIVIDIVHRHRRHRILKEPTRLGPDVAVVAVWPRFPLRHSVQRLLEALRAEGWSVVLVANESPDLDRVIDAWSTAADTVIRRTNIGRDFGAYQCGYSYLRRRAEWATLERLAFFNDSVLYPMNIRRALAELGALEATLSGFFVNRQYQIHVQSFAMVVGRGFAASPEFESFWRTYFPSSIRRYVIQQGEIALTRLVIRTQPDIDAVVTYERLGRALPAGWSGLGDVDRRILMECVEGRDEVERRSRERWDPSEVDVARCAREAFADRNTTHALGLVASRRLSVPLKVDLVRRGMCSADEFEGTLRDLDLDDDEIDGVMEMVLASGTLDSLGFLGRLMHQTGFDR